MEEFEYQLRQAMEGKVTLDQAQVDQLRQTITQTYEVKRKKVLLRLYVWLAITMASFVGAVVYFNSATTLKDQLFCVLIALVMFESTVLIKLWFWVVNCNITAVRELKQVQACLAGLAGRLPRS